jgi:hypothetical protein
MFTCRNISCDLRLRIYVLIEEFCLAPQSYICCWVINLDVRSPWLSLPSYEMSNCLVVFYVDLWSSILRDVSWPAVVWPGTQFMDWDCGLFGNVPYVQIGIVDGLERCLEYGLGHGRYPTCGLGIWMAWKGTLCKEWDCGWFGKVPGVRFGSWSVPGVRIGNVDGLERYLVYRMGLWMFGKVPRVRFGWWLLAW